MSQGSCAQSSQPKGSISARSRRPMFPKPTKPTRLPNSRNVSSPSAAHNHRSTPDADVAVAAHDVAAARERQAERELGNRVRECGCGGEHANTTLPALHVLDLRRPAARDRQDRPEAGSLVEDRAIAPAARDDRERAGECLAKGIDRHGLVPFPHHVDRRGESPLVRRGEDVAHRPEVGIDDDLRPLCHGCSAAHVVTTAVLLQFSELGTSVWNCH